VANTKSSVDSRDDQAADDSIRRGETMAPARKLRTRWLLGVLLVGPFMAQADATIANVATPSIHTDLGASGESSCLAWRHCCVVWLRVRPCSSLAV
jgi:hypothetical protein